MSTLKTLCILVVLSAVGYGAYVTLTGEPTNGPPPEAGQWEQGPVVELPEKTSPGPTEPAVPAVVTGAVPLSPPSSSLTTPSLATSPPPTIVPPADATPSMITPPTTETTSTGGPDSTGTTPPAVTLPASPTDPATMPPAVSLGAETTSSSPTSTTTPPDLGSATPGGSPPFITPPLGPPSTTSPSSSYSTTPGTMPGDATSTASTMAPPGSSSGSTGPVATLTPPGIESPGTTPPAAAGDAHAEFTTAMTSVQGLLTQNKLADAHLALSEWYDNPRLGPLDQQQTNDLLDQLAGSVVYSRQPLLEPMYIVQPGDTLERIAERYEVPWQLLAKINGIADPKYVRAGDQLKVVRGPFDAIINLQKFELTLSLRGRYAGRFKIGIGQDQSTPTGEFVVKNKVSNPTYYGPGVIVEADDPNNPLGERWIDLGNQIGIHGTNDPQSIGKAESRGCIRLSPSDVEDVYDILSVGSRILIRR